MIKYFLLTICFGIIQSSVYAQNTWVKIQPGMNNMSVILQGDTIITVGNAGDFDYNYINMNHADSKTGDLLKTDSILYLSSKLEMKYPWNTMYFDKSTINFRNEVLIGLIYYDSVGSDVKWRAGIYSMKTKNLINVNLNTDTFTHYFIGFEKIDKQVYVINQWMNPDNDKSIIPNFEIVSIDKNGNKKSVYKVLNKNLRSWNMVRGIADDNQSDNTFFVNKELAWDFMGVPMQFETNILKMDTTGAIIWSSKLNYTDSLNMLGTPFVQKNNGNLLAMWNNIYYRPYMKPGYNSHHYQINDSATLCLAEVDYVTGKIINRKNYRKFLFKHLTHNFGYLKSETNQDFVLTDAIKVSDGVVWTGYRSFFQDKLPYSLVMPFLFKTDLSGKPIWYRDYFVFPDSETDEGMLVNSILQTPDGGFVLAGENRDFSRTDVQRSILVKVDSFGCLVPGCQLKDNINENILKKCTLFPNPSTSIFTITLPNTNETWSYQIIDNTGKILENGNLQQEQNQISTQNLPNGIYQIILQNPKTNHHENHSFIIAR